MLTRILDAKQALPSGRLGFTFDEDTVTLYSIQRLGVLEALDRDGLAVPTLEHSDHHEDWPIAYDWMARKVAAHTGVDHATGAVFWAWAYTTRRSLVSSLTHSARWARENDSTEVLLTLRVPVERVLVTCFSDWHSVLMALPVLSPAQALLAQEAFDRDEEFNGPIIDAFCARTGKDWWSYEDATSEELEQCQDSWDHCLRPAGVRPRSRQSHWQACVPDIRLSDVTDAVILN